MAEVEPINFISNSIIIQLYTSMKHSLMVTLYLHQMAHGFIAITYYKATLSCAI